MRADGEALGRAARGDIFAEPLAPLLLDEAGRLAVNHAPLLEAVEAMRILLADAMAKSDLAEAVKQAGQLSGIAATNLWVDALGRHWFCILSPSERQNQTHISDYVVSTTVEAYHEG